MSDTGLRLRSITPKPGVTMDSLMNAITGMGTARDQRTRTVYSRAIPLSQQQIADAYSGSGLMRKIINIPPLDMVREGRDWKAEQEQITALEAEEDRLGLWQKIRQAEVLRGMGGGALILGLPGDLAQPAPATVAKGKLEFMHVVGRWHLTYDQLEDDARLPGFGEPRMWKLNTDSGQVPLHPSRVVPFRGDTTLGLVASTFAGQDAFWGESVVQQVLEAVTDNDTVRSSFVSLVAKARTLRVGIPKLMDLVSTGDGDALVAKRISMLALAESIHNAFIYDAGDPESDKGGEKIDDAQYNFAGAKDIFNAYGEFVAAISDIPATRLLGRAPEGMNASGDSQQKDWNKLVMARQKLDLRPCLNRVDAYLIPSALGSRPPEVWSEFAPLDTPSEKERADTFFTKMQGVEKLQATATIPDQALAKGVQSMLIDDGIMPELEQALLEIPEEERYGMAQAEEGDDEELSPGDPSGGSRTSGDPFADAQARWPAGSRRGGQFKGRAGPSISSAKDAGAFTAAAFNGKIGGQIEIGRVSGATSTRIHAATGIDTKGKRVGLDGSMVRHIANKHGSANEVLSGQIPVTSRDIARAGTHIAKADGFRIGSPAHGRAGHPRFEAKRTVRGVEYTIIGEVRKHRVLVQNMWKKPRA